MQTWLLAWQRLYPWYCHVSLSVLCSDGVPFAVYQILPPVAPTSSVAPMEGVFIYIWSATETMTAWITLMNRTVVSWLITTVTWCFITLFLMDFYLSLQLVYFIMFGTVHGSTHGKFLSECPTITKTFYGTFLKSNFRLWNTCYQYPLKITVKERKENQQLGYLGVLKNFWNTIKTHRWQCIGMLYMHTWKDLIDFFFPNLHCGCTIDIVKQFS